MKNLATVFLLFILFFGYSQNMKNSKLKEIINETTDNIQGESGRWQFQINEKILIVLTDSTNNRMRIISPIADTISLEDNMLENALIANFHSALDVKYAISEGVLWSTFIHPLQELSEAQVKDAISQVYYANVNFGTTYASTSLIFPGSKKEKSEVPNKNVLKTKKT